MKTKTIVITLQFTLLVSGLFAQEKNDKKTESKQNESKTVFIPYKDIKTVINKKNATVIMPYAQYLQLIKKAGDASQKELGPSAVITSASYIGNVAKDRAEVTAKLTVQVLGDPWVSLPIQFGDAAIGKVTHQGDGDVLLQGTGKGKYALLFSKKGTFEISLQLIARVRTSPEGRQFQLECPSSGITNLELTVPQRDQTVEITPKPVLLPAKENNENKKITTIKATLGSTNKIIARWFPRVSAKPEMDLLTSINNQQTISIADGMIHTTAKLQYKILRGELDQLRVAVPLGHQILDVSVPDAKLKSWKATADANRQVVAISFLGTIKEKLTIEIHTETATPGGPFEISGIDETGKVHGIHTIDSLRESGSITLSHEQGITLAVEQKQGVVRVASNQVAGQKQPADVTSRKLVYKFFNAKFLLKVSARPVKPHLVVTQAARLIFRDDELQLQTTFHYKIERAGLFEMQYQIPQKITIDQVTANVKMEQSFDKATRLLTITFPQKQTSQVTVSLKGHRDLDAKQDQADQKLPVIEPLAVARETGTIYLFAPESMEVVTDEKRLTGLFPVSKTAAAPDAQTRLIASWEYSRRPVMLFVKTVRKPTRLLATLATTIHVKQELLRVKSLLSYQVQYAGIDLFRIEVPEKIADSIHIEIANDGASVPIKQIDKEDAPVKGFVGINIQTQRTVLGKQQFNLSYDLSPKEQAEKIEFIAGKKAPSNILYQQDLPLLRVVDVPNERPIGAIDIPPKDIGKKTHIPISRLEGEIAIQKDRALTVSATEQGDDIEQIDLRELRHLPQSGTLAYQYFKQPITLSLVVKKYEIQEVVQTVISRAGTEVVIGRDPRATYRCRYRIMTSERQRLKIQLPKDAQLQGVFVDRKEVSLEKDDSVAEEKEWDTYFVNVARTKKANETLLLSLLFSWDGYKDAFESWGKPLLVRLPRIGDQNNQVVLQEQRCRLWIPKRYSLVGRPHNFHSRQSPGLMQVLLGHQSRTRQSKMAQSEMERWLGCENMNLFEFPTEGHRLYEYSRLGKTDSIQVTSLRIPYLTIIVSGTLLLIAFVLIQLNWEKKLLLLLVIAFALTLYALRDSDWAIHIFAAASYGLVAMLGVWLIHELFRKQKPQPALVSGATVSSGGSATANSSTSTTPETTQEVIPPPDATSPPAETPPDVNQQSDSSDSSHTEEDNQ